MMRFRRQFKSAVAAALLAFIPASSQAATLLVEGFLEGSANQPVLRGDTMDYYKFEMLTDGPVRIEVIPEFGGFLFEMASFIGLEDRFGFIGNPFRIIPPGPDGHPQFLERHLDQGEYVVVTQGGGRTSYDIFDGYVAVNPEGGGFRQARYAYTIIGDVRGLEYWDGHLDGTFTVTLIPEPSMALLATVGGCWLVCTRRRWRFGRF